jgi:hypothetical protein
MMQKLLAIAALLVSIGLYACQVIMFTTLLELIAYGVLGVLLYLAINVLAKRAAAPRGPSIKELVFASVIVGVILGLLPPRLRLGGDLTPFVIFFPTVHCLALLVFILLIRSKSRIA